MNISGVGEMGVGETGVGKTGQIIGETGVGETGTSQQDYVIVSSVSIPNNIYKFKTCNDIFDIQCI